MPEFKEVANLKCQYWAQKILDFIYLPSRSTNNSELRTKMLEDTVFGNKRSAIKR